MPDPASAVTSVLDPVSGQLARVYAAALLDLLDDSSAEEIYRQMQSLIEVLDHQPEFDLLFSSLLLRARQRTALVERVFRDRLDPNLEGLLSVMARNGRLDLIRSVAGQFRRLLDEREGKVEVIVTSAIPLDESMLGELTQALREILHGEPLLKTQVDRDVLGGFRLHVGDEVLDTTLTSQLSRMKKQLNRRDSGSGGE